MLESIKVSFGHEVDWGEFNPFNFNYTKTTIPVMWNVKVPTGTFMTKFTFFLEVKTNGRMLFTQKTTLHSNKDSNSAFRRLSLISISKENYSSRFKIVKKKGKTSKRLEKLLQRTD